MIALHRLAEAAGVAVRWRDAEDQAQNVRDEALIAILGALGHPAESPHDIALSLEALSDCDQRAPNFLSADIGSSIPLPGAWAERASIEIEYEDGRMERLPLDDSNMLPPLSRPGYYRLHAGGDVITLAVAPPRCIPCPAGKKLWGPALQIPALRGPNGSSFGDFDLLADAARAFAAAGADAIAISPVHALYPGDGRRYSPYAPSSRRFLNTALVAAAPLEKRVDAPLIDWLHAIPQRHAALRQSLASADAPQDGDEGLHDYALYECLYIHFGERGWRDWPPAYHDPHGPAVKQFAAEHAGHVRLHQAMQQAASQGPARVQRAARDAGMAIGLIADLAVGIDPGGADAWLGQDLYLTGLTIGAPPDPLGPLGQNWGLTTFAPDRLKAASFAPWIAMLRANLRHAGGLRIDHGFGLQRLWVVPEGASSADGAYLSCPFWDQLRILAIESHLADAIMIAEDLGTIPDGFREAIGARGIYGMRVLWFERSENGAFADQSAFGANAVAMTGTHDTPTIAGWWSGADIAVARDLGQIADSTEAEAERAADRKALWRAIGDGTPEPSSSGPVIDAAFRHIGASSSPLAIIPLEDIAAVPDQVNVPGTVDEYPNWRRRMPAPVEDLLTNTATAARITALDEARSQ